GMKLARNAAELAEALPLARAEAKAAFGDDSIYLERYLDRPRHIEVQLLGDGQGGVVHLGERDCSLQRSHQKLLEETPSPALGSRQSDIRLRGHAIECRINAESSVDFRPSPGRVDEYHAPGGPGVRVDSALYQGYAIPPYYDSLIAKLVIFGNSRDECLMRLR